MEIFANAMFYLLATVALASVFLILFAKDVKIYVLGAIATFISICGIYILLKSPLMFIVQSIFFVIGTGTVIFLGTRDFSTDRKAKLNFNKKTFSSIFLLCVFTLLVAPFFIYQISSQTVNTPAISQSAEMFAPFINLGLFLLSILLIALLSGFYTIAFWRKK